MKHSKALELFILSAISLYVELLIIRWLCSDIRAFTVFRTFPLISCFVGLGIGFSIGKDSSYRFFPLMTLMLALTVKLVEYLGIWFLAFPSVGIAQANVLPFLLLPHKALLIQFSIAFMLLIIWYLAFPFAMCVTIGSRLGVLFSQFKPLPAYSINVAGAIVGSVLFQSLSAWRLAPWQLSLIPVAVVVIDLILKDKKVRLSYIAPFILIPLATLLLPNPHGQPLLPLLEPYQLKEAKTIWSPYQRIDMTLFVDPTKKEAEQKPFGLQLSANRAFFQYYFDTKEDTPIGHSPWMDTVRKDYHLPFSFNNPKDVLIVGAGVGLNVSAALAANAARVDAVEIDPVVLEIGRKYNPDYSSSRVNLICDDARHFISRATNKYDVINFSLLDSHTVAGLGSSVRIDNYVYTKENFAKALSLLKDNGIMQIWFATNAVPELAERLYSTLRDVAGYPPLVLQGSMVGSTVYTLGPAVKSGQLKIPAGYNRINLSGVNFGRQLTDDWPYLYVQPDVIDWPYLLVLLEIVLLSIFAARRYIFAQKDLLSWHMFFMGAAFMLLELHGISFLSLLYGSTWITAAIVINCILVMILLANAFVYQFAKQLTKAMPLVYLCLFGSILASYLLPTDALLMQCQTNQLAIYTLMTGITVLPMGIAAIVFATAFNEMPNISQAIAFNLFGAVIGGLLEYLSNYWGIRSLDLVAAGFYLASAICFFRGRQLSWWKIT